MRFIARRPFSVGGQRSWSGEDARRHWLERMEERFPDVLDDPDLELLVEVSGGEVGSFLLLQHGAREGSTRKNETIMWVPSWVESPAILEEAARRARAKGSLMLSTNVLMGDVSQAEWMESAGMVAEYQRVVLALDGALRRSPEHARMQAALSRGARNLLIRPAEESDRLFLMRLSTECAAMMFHERRRADLPLMQERFLDSYTLIPLGPESPVMVRVAETVDGAPAGAIYVDPEAEHGLDGRCEAYVYDISVLPQYWGRAVGAILLNRAIEELREAGVAWLSGDISTDNHRVSALTARFGFDVETRHYVRMLKEEENHDEQ